MQSLPLFLNILWLKFGCRVGFIRLWTNRPEWILTGGVHLWGNRSCGRITAKGTNIIIWWESRSTADLSDNCHLSTLCFSEHHTYRGISCQHSCYWQDVRTLKSNLSPLTPVKRQKKEHNHCQKYETVFLSDSTDQSSSATSCNRDDKAVLLITHTAKQSLHQMPVCKVELVCLQSGLEDSFYWKTPLMFWNSLKPTAGWYVYL